MAEFKGKKWIRFSLSILLITLVMVCFLIYRYEKTQIKRKVIELDPAALISEDGEFAYPGFAFGSSMEMIEEAGRFYFPEIPYWSDEWIDGTLPYHPEKVFDYRHNKDYGDHCYGAEFAAYYRGEPIYVKYRDHVGYMTFNFDQGAVTDIYIYFGEAAPRQDAKMDYGGTGNDVKAVYQDLKEDLKSTIDVSVAEEQEGKYGGGSKERIVWRTPVKEDGSFTKLTVMRFESGDPERNMTTLNIKWISPETDRETEDHTINITGASMTIETFIENYAFVEKAVIDREAGKYKEAQLTLSHITINERKIEFDVCLKSRDKVVDEFHLSGFTYSGYRQEVYGYPSIVLDMTSTSEDSEVLLFDLVDGPGKPNFFADEKATDLDAIRIYIRRGDDIFMFENRLPNVFRKCFEQKNVPIGDPTKDILWYSSFISPETELIKIE